MQCSLRNRTAPLIKEEPLGLSSTLAMDEIFATAIRRMITMMMLPQRRRALRRRPRRRRARGHGAALPRRPAGEGAARTESPDACWRCAGALKTARLPV